MFGFKEILLIMVETWKKNQCGLTLSKILISEQCNTPKSYDYFNVCVYAMAWFGLLLSNLFIYFLESNTNNFILSL